MKRILWLAAILAVPASILIACSGDDSSVASDSDAGSGGDATVGTGTDSSTGQDSGPPSSDSGPPHADSGPVVDPATCKDAGTANDCAACCESAYPNAETKAQEIAIACACIGPDAGGDGGVCAKECATTACAATPAAPDKACNACLQKGGADSCEGKAVVACESDTACKAFLACGQTCPKK